MQATSGETDVNWASCVVYDQWFIAGVPQVEEEKPAGMEGLRLLLERLESIDRRREVFGASLDQYESHPVSEEELQRLEDALGVCLPADYRQFLKEIGYGAGPYYGLYGPDQIVSELEELGLWPENGSILSAAPDQAFPFTRQQAEECWRIMGEHRYAMFLASVPTNGCVPICTEGCSFHTYLVTAGELIGSLWSHSAEYVEDWEELGYEAPVASWNLAPEPPGVVRWHWDTKVHERLGPVWETALSPFPTFGEWYRAWLERALSDFAQSDGQQR